MPIIDIELVEDEPKIEPDTHGVRDAHGIRDNSITQMLADELGSLFISEAGGTWIRLRFLPSIGLHSPPWTLDPLLGVLTGVVWPLDKRQRP